MRQIDLNWPGKREERVTPGEYRLVETFEPSADGADFGDDARCAGSLYLDDNRPVLARLAAEHAGKVRLAYLDPPYLSGVAYSREVSLRQSGTPAGRVVEFDDRLGEADYLQRLYDCLWLVRDLLAPDGSVWLHCDFRQSHHLRCLLDEVLGADAFRNEVVWAYSSAARGAKAVGRQLPRNHDVLLWYAGPAAKYRPLTADVRIPGSLASRAGYQLDGGGRPFRTAPRGDYTDTSLARLAEQGRIHQSRSGRVRIKYYARRVGDDVVEERLLGDVWTDVPDAMHLPADEPTGYPTQKPERLLERVILASTDPGDLVLDPFAGSGTTLAVAQRLGRRWIGVDASRGAIQTCRRRLMGVGGPSQPSLFETDLTSYPPSPKGRGEDEGIPREGRPESAESVDSSSPHPSPLPEGEGTGRSPEGEAPSSPLPFSEGGQGVRSFGIYEPLDRAEANPGQAMARLRVERLGEGDASRLSVGIEGYHSSALSARLGADPEWREALDCVLIDPDYDGLVFRARLADAPTGRREPVAGRYEIPQPRPGARVAIKVVDVLGEETLVLLPE